MPQTAISIPPRTREYTHRLADGRLCQSAWAQHQCSCGMYALTWETEEMVWGGSRPRPIDGLVVPDDPTRTSAQPLSQFEFIPKNQGIIVILAEAIEGPYRFAHDAWRPYVIVGPSTPDQAIVVHTTPRLQLKSPTRRHQLTGVHDTMTFAVMLEGADTERLVEVDTRVRQPRLPRARPVTPPPDPLPPSMAIPHVTPTAPLPRLVVAPEPTPPVRTPPPVDAPVPEIIEAIRQKAGLDIDQGDYLVIPRDSVPATVPLPDWVVRYDVDRIYVHKPRDGVHYPFGEEPADGE